MFDGVNGSLSGLFLGDDNGVCLIFLVSLSFGPKFSEVWGPDVREANNLGSLRRRALVAHIDREKRKKRNAGEKRRMIQEIGKGSIGADKAT